MWSTIFIESPLPGNSSYLYEWDGWWLLEIHFSLVTISVSAPCYWKIHKFLTFTHSNSFPFSAAHRLSSPTVLYWNALVKSSTMTILLNPMGNFKSSPYSSASCTWCCLILFLLKHFCHMASRQLYTSSGHFFIFFFYVSYCRISKFEVLPQTQIFRPLLLFMT